MCIPRLNSSSRAVALMLLLSFSFTCTGDSTSRASGRVSVHNLQLAPSSRNPSQDSAASLLVPDERARAPARKLVQSKRLGDGEGKAEGAVLRGRKRRQLWQGRLGHIAESRLSTTRFAAENIIGARGFAPWAHLSVNLRGGAISTDEEQIIGTEELQTDDMEAGLEDEGEVNKTVNALSSWCPFMLRLITPKSFVRRCLCGNFCSEKGSGLSSF